MREDPAAVNVTRTYTLAASNMAIFTFMLFGAMSDTERASHARRADRFWLLGYTTMFLAPSLVLFLIRPDRRICLARPSGSHTCAL